MSEIDYNAQLDELAEVFSDLIPYLTADQAKELEQLWSEGDVEAVYFMLSYIMKHTRELYP